MVQERKTIQDEVCDNVPSRQCDVVTDRVYSRVPKQECKASSFLFEDFKDLILNA